MVLIVSLRLEGGLLYLLDRIAKAIYGDDYISKRPSALSKGLSAMRDIVYEARDGSALWYKTNQYSPRFDFQEPEFGLDELDEEDESDATPIFPYSEDGRPTWHPIVINTLASIEVPIPYRESPCRLFVVGAAAKLYKDLSQNFGDDIGDPINDLLLTTLNIGNAIEDLQQKGTFYFQDIKEPVPRTKVFFEK